MQKSPEKVRSSEILGYGVGQAACNTCWGLVSAFLIYFYTDVFAISASLAGSITLISRLWDGINDPIIGSLADRTTTKWGSYRPWILFSAPLLMVSNILLFWAHPDWPVIIKNIYALSTYALLVLAYTMVSVPYGALPGVMTRDTNERTKLTTARNFSGTLTSMIISANFIVFASWLGKGNMPNGFLYGAIVLSVLSLPLFVITFLTCKEKVARPALTTKRANFMDGIRLLKGNKPLVISVILFVVQGIEILCMGTVMIYYFRYVANDYSLFSVWKYCTNIPMLIGNICAPIISKKIGHKGKTGAYASIFSGALLFILFFIGQTKNWTMFFIVAAIYGLCCGTMTSMCYAVVPDVATYTYNKTGTPQDGTCFALTGFANKCGMAIGGFLIGNVLQFFGYVANQPQTALVQNVISCSAFWGCGVMLVICGIIFIGYRLDAKEYQKVIAEIDAKQL